jgi:hypothetical protein
MFFLEGGEFTVEVVIVIIRVCRLTRVYTGEAIKDAVENDSVPDLAAEKLVRLWHCAFID